MQMMMGLANIGQPFPFQAPLQHMLTVGLCTTAYVSTIGLFLLILTLGAKPV